MISCAQFVIRSKMRFPSFQKFVNRQRNLFRAGGPFHKQGVFHVIVNPWQKSRATPKVDRSGGHADYISDVWNAMGWFNGWFSTPWYKILYRHRDVEDAAELVLPLSR